MFMTSLISLWVPRTKILKNGAYVFKEKGRKKFISNKIDKGKLIKNRNKKCSKKYKVF